MQNNLRCAVKYRRYGSVPLDLFHKLSILQPFSKFIEIIRGGVHFWTKLQDLQMLKNDLQNVCLGNFSNISRTCSRTYCLTWVFTLILFDIDSKQGFNGNITPQCFFRISVLEKSGKLYKNYARWSTFLNIIAGLCSKMYSFVYDLSTLFEFSKNPEPLRRDAFALRSPGQVVIVLGHFQLFFKNVTLAKKNSKIKI